MSAIEWFLIACEAILIWLCVLLGVGSFGLWWLFAMGSLPI